MRTRTREATRPRSPHTCVTHARSPPSSPTHLFHSLFPFLHILLAREHQVHYLLTRAHPPLSNSVCVCVRACVCACRCPCKHRAQTQAQCAQAPRTNTSRMCAWEHHPCCCACVRGTEPFIPWRNSASPSRAPSHAASEPRTALRCRTGSWLLCGAMPRLPTRSVLCAGACVPTHTRVRASGVLILCVRFLERQANRLYFCVSAGDQLRGEQPCSSDCRDGADCHTVRQFQADYTPFGCARLSVWKLRVRRAFQRLSESVSDLIVSDLIWVICAHGTLTRIPALAHTHTPARPFLQRMQTSSWQCPESILAIIIGFLASLPLCSAETRPGTHSQKYSL